MASLKSHTVEEIIEALQGGLEVWVYEDKEGHEDVLIGPRADVVNDLLNWFDVREEDDLPDGWDLDPIPSVKHFLQFILELKDGRIFVVDQATNTVVTIAEDVWDDILDELPYGSYNCYAADAAYKRGDYWQENAPALRPEDYEVL